MKVFSPRGDMEVVVVSGSHLVDWSTFWVFSSSCDLMNCCFGFYPIGILTRPCVLQGSVRAVEKNKSSDCCWLTTWGPDTCQRSFGISLHLFVLFALTSVALGQLDTTVFPLPFQLLSFLPIFCLLLRVELQFLMIHRFVWEENRAMVLQWQR